MRVVLMSPLPPERTGIADYAAQCRHALNGAGVDVLTPLLGQKPIESLADAHRWVAERDWSRVDVVHAEIGGGRTSEFFALCALARLPDRPALSITVHDPERLVWRPVSRIWRALDASGLLPRPLMQLLAVLCDPHTLWAERRLARQIDGLVTLTDTGANRLAARMGIPRDKITVIPLGTLEVPPAPLPPLPPEGPLKLLYFGYIYTGKGIEDLVDALARVIAKQGAERTPVRLTIAGGTAPDITYGAGGSYLDALRARVAAKGLDAQVDWELDIDERDIARLIQRHHVMVLPYWEPRKLSLLGQMRGTSAALAWAIASGRGAITSNARSFAEEISSGNGQAYPQGDVSALTQVLAALMEAPEQAAAWARQAAVLSSQRLWPLNGLRFRQHFDALSKKRLAQGRTQPRPTTLPPSAQSTARPTTKRL